MLSFIFCVFEIIQTLVIALNGAEKGLITELPFFEENFIRRKAKLKNIGILKVRLNYFRLS